MISRGLTAAALSLAVIASVAAETGQGGKGPNGGAMVTVDNHPIEFVVRGQEIVFYIGDHDGKPNPTQGHKARAVVQDGGKTTTVALAATPPNMFVGKLPAPLGPKARVVFSGSIEGHTLQARFTAP